MTMEPAPKGADPDRDQGADLFTVEERRNRQRHDDLTTASWAVTDNVDGHRVPSSDFSISQPRRFSARRQFPQM